MWSSGIGNSYTEIPVDIVHEGHIVPKSSHYPACPSSPRHSSGQHPIFLFRGHNELNCVTQKICPSYSPRCLWRWLYGPKIISPLIRMGPKSNDKCPYKREKRRTDTHIGRKAMWRRRHRSMWCIYKAKELQGLQQPPEAGREAYAAFSLSFQKQPILPTAWFWTSVFQYCDRITPCCFEPPSLWYCYSSPQGTNTTQLTNPFWPCLADALHMLRQPPNPPYVVDLSTPPGVMKGAGNHSTSTTSKKLEILFLLLV